LNYEHINSKLINYFNREEYIEDLTLARSDFEKAAGIIDEDEDNFESKTRQFHDWFLYSRPIKGGKRPIAYAINDKEFEPDKLFLINASSSQHSLFELLKVKKDFIKVRNLFTKKKYKVLNNFVALEFHAGDFFEARVIEFDDQMQFTGSFCFHPKEAKKFILTEVKQVRKIKEENEKQLLKEKLIFRLFRMNHKLGQYKHLSTDQVYSNSSQFKL